MAHIYLASYLTALLLYLTLLSISSDKCFGSFYDPVHCYTNSSNCTFYLHQTLTFVCDCFGKNCVTKWESNGNSSGIKCTNGVDYTITVTNNISGIMVCSDDLAVQYYVWHVTVLPPVPPKFVQTPQNNRFKSQEIYIGDIDHPICVLCVNCTVTGAPAPVVTWEYLHGSTSEFIPIITNQSNASSPYYVQDNGQNLCFNDITKYHLVSAQYQCNATNVGGSIYGRFSADVNVRCPLPTPGKSATMSSISLRGHKVTLTMDTHYNYPESTFFRVCPYNSSCCFCDSKEKCEWGELSGHTDSVRKYVSCQFTTSQPGLYQFQIKTDDVNGVNDNQLNRPLLPNDNNENYHSSRSATNNSPANNKLALTLPDAASVHGHKEPNFDPFAHKDLICNCKKIMYVAYGEDSKQWVTDTLIPFLATLNVEVVTISDAIPGKTQLSARTDLIKEASKMIIVISKQSIKDKKNLYDISKAQHKEPDPTKITIIPILFENATPEDVPTQIMDLTLIRNNDAEFEVKIKRSVCSCDIHTVVAS